MGFLEDGQYQKLVEGSDLWFRAMVEVGRTYGWRISELREMKVSQVNLLNRTIRLEPGTTKNGEGREVSMTKASMSCWRAGSVVRVPTIMCLPGQMVNESKIFESSGGTPVCRLECPTYFFMTSSAPPPATSVGQVWPRA